MSKTEQIQIYNLLASKGDQVNKVTTAKTIKFSIDESVDDILAELDTLLDRIETIREQEIKRKEEIEKLRDALPVKK